MIDQTDALGELFLRIARRIRRQTLTRIRPLGLNPHLSRALRVIGDAGPIRPSAVAERLDIAPRSASDSIATLLASGWIERTPDPEDRRAYRISLTPAGRELSAQVHAIRRQVATEFFGELSAVDRDQLTSILQHLDTEAP